MNYYVGINALTLDYLHKHLTGEETDENEMRAMEGGIRWALKCELDKLKDRPKDSYWAKVTLADLELLVGTPASVEKAYKAAVAVAEDNWFALDSSQQQLLLLQLLGFKPENIAAGLKVFERAMRNLKPTARWAPRQVLLFTGHMIDRADRPQPRFPADKVPVATAAINKKLDELGASADDLGICSGACGGDLIFAEACLKRGMQVEFRLPFDHPTFMRESVSFAGDEWRDRFYVVKDHEKVGMMVMPEELGPAPNGVFPHVRNNRWMLYNALQWGPDKVNFICLWDGKAGDGPGGTKDMYELVQQQLGRVHWIDTTKLW